ncbi:MAG: hypothetical protein ACJ79K_05235 [Gemmatimonadaceae bacterium]
MLSRVLRGLSIAGMLSAGGATALSAQSTPATTPATTPTPAPAPAAAPQAPAPALDFSGVIFGNYQYRTDSLAKAQTGGKSPNQFVIDRVYLTFRMPVGDRASIRATTDIVQNANGAYYNGWSVRLKYGYLQYNFLQNLGGHPGFNALARVGMLHTVVIDHEEGFWPRYLSQTAVERFGFFSSADLGAASQLSLPGKMGEIYGTITNGPGYTSPEVDRFKDLALRVTLTPLGTHAGLLQTLAISPWVYRGRTASKYAAGGRGQVAPVTDGLTRDRWGIFAGIKDPRLVVAAHYARRTEGFETGANTLASPRVAAPDSSGTLWSAYTVVRPIQWTSGKNTAKLGIVARWDRFTPRTTRSGVQRLAILGLQWEPTSRTALALDYQDVTPQDYNGPAPITETRGWYLHWNASF